MRKPRSSFHKQAKCENVQRPYALPALRKVLAALPAASKVDAASLAVIATVVSMSDRLPPAAAASTAEAATFSSGNSPMTSQSCRPKVKYQPMSLPPTLLNRLATASSRFFWFGQHALDRVRSELTARNVNRHGISPV